MNLYQIQREVEALKRRFPIHYNLNRLRPYAEQFCDDWEYCVGMGFDPPSFNSHPRDSDYPPRREKARPFMDRIRRVGIISRDWLSLKKYLDNCRDERIYPHPNEILRITLPRAAYLELIPPSPDPISYRAIRGDRPQLESPRLGAGGSE